MAVLAVRATQAGNALDVSFALTYAAGDVEIVSYGGYDVVSMRGTACSGEVGTPALPAFTVYVALPPGMQADEVRLRSYEPVDLPGSYEVMPVQPPRAISSTAEPPENVKPDGRIYDQADAYPAEPVQLVGQVDLAGQGIAVLEVRPLVYLPASRRLRLYERLSIEVFCEPGYRCGDYLAPTASAAARAAYEKTLRELVVNPEAVELRAESGQPCAVGTESRDYVIITTAERIADFAPLAAWRTRCGLRAKIVTTDWIYNSGGYSGTEQEKIRAFVADAHQIWGATYLLVGGDSDAIPCHVRTITVPGYFTHDIPNDTFYADYDGDSFCEVHVGRLGFRSSEELEAVLAKILAYEQDPPLTSYARTAAFFGFDISSTGDDAGELCKERVRALHLPADWTLVTEYDGEAGRHRADVVAYVNQGHHIINHFDHCSADAMGVGWLNHGDYLTVVDVAGFSNGDRQSLVFATGCYPADFTLATCIGEAWVKNPAGGAVSFIGNTKLGWSGPSYAPDHYTVLQDRLFYEALYDQEIERLGECFTYAKNGAREAHDPYHVSAYCFTQLTLLSDPGITIWTDDPQSLFVTHPSFVGIGTPAVFSVHVDDGAPLDGATVCVWKGDEVYDVRLTVNGAAEFELLAGTPGTLFVTASKRNYRPYTGEARVGVTGDFNGNETVDVDDWSAFGSCMSGPSVGEVGSDCGPGDFDADRDLDLADFSGFQGAFGPDFRVAGECARQPD